MGKHVRDDGGGGWVCFGSFWERNAKKKKMREERTSERFAV